MLVHGGHAALGVAYGLGSIGAGLLTAYAVERARAPGARA